MKKGHFFLFYEFSITPGTVNAFMILFISFFIVFASHLHTSIFIKETDLKAVKAVRLKEAKNLKAFNLKIVQFINLIQR